VSKLLVGIVDYGAGNCSAVRAIVSRLGLRSRLIKAEADFEGLDLLVIPGVGAFPSAMSALLSMRLVEPIKMFASTGRPLMGVCLGMQLLADVSYEMGETDGLGLIPGEVVPIGNPRWHIGWNNLEWGAEGRLNTGTEDECVYFNHAFEYRSSDKYVKAIAIVDRPLVAVVRNKNVLGFQFHPEKSQITGRHIMSNAIKDLLGA
jgi:imidazole glycerol-phosphate synthase subunit HisH